MATNVAILSDIHANSTVALCPPTVNLDDGGTYRASRAQRWLYKRFQEFAGEVARRREETGKLVVILNGELADDNYHGKYQLVDPNPKTQMATAVKALKPMLDLLRPDDSLYVIRGTEAHSGRSAWMDDKIGEDLGAVSPREGVHSYWHLQLNVDGVKFDVAHHPPLGPGRMPWTRGQYAMRLAAFAYMDGVQAGEKPPDLYVRGHYHVPGDSYDAYPVRAIAMPSWQLTTAFGYRIGSSRALPVGGVIVTCDRGRYEVAKHLYSWLVAGYDIA